MLTGFDFLFSLFISQLILFGSVLTGNLKVSFTKAWGLGTLSSTLMKSEVWLMSTHVLGEISLGFKMVPLCEPLAMCLQDQHLHFSQGSPERRVMMSNANTSLYDKGRILTR